MQFKILCIFFEIGGSTILIILRVIVGCGEGVMFPACNTLLAAWTPLKERSITATIVYSGMYAKACYAYSF